MFEIDLFVWWICIIRSPASEVLVGRIFRVERFLTGPRHLTLVALGPRASSPWRFHSFVELCFSCFFLFSFRNDEKTEISPIGECDACHENIRGSAPETKRDISLISNPVDASLSFSVHVWTKTMTSYDRTSKGVFFRFKRNPVYFRLIFPTRGGYF